jgi:hypothetical protein
MFVRACVCLLTLADNRMMDDVLVEETLHKLPALDVVACGDVIRDEVFCTKIIHQKATHQSRFTWSSTYRKIMEFSYPGMCVSDTSPTALAQHPRPLRSPFPCFQCHLRFDGAPVFLPITTLGGLRTEWGNFCDPACVNTYLHRNMNDSNLAARAADLFEYCQDVHGFKGTDIGFAPHFSEMDAYGGALSEAAFRKIAHTPGLRTFERMAPFIPTPAVVEWQCQVSDVDVAAAASAAAVVVHSAKQQQHATLMATAAGLAPFNRGQPAAVRSAAAQERDTLLAAAAAQTGLARHLRTVNGDDLSSLASGGSATTAAPTSAAAAALDVVLGPRADAASAQHQWEVTGLRQPSQEQIEKRLMSLPRPEKKVGLYDLYWARHAAAADEEAAAAAATTAVANGTDEAAAAGPAALKKPAVAKARPAALKKRSGGGGTKRPAPAVETTAAPPPPPTAGFGANLIAAKRART